MKVKRLLEKNIPWLWYWLHPIDALEISHYGYMDIITDKDYYKGIKIE